MTTDALPGLSLEVVPPPPEQDVLRTDVAAFLGRTRRGPVGVPVRVQSRLEYESLFGPVDRQLGDPATRSAATSRTAAGPPGCCGSPARATPRARSGRQVTRCRVGLGLPAVPGARDQPGRLGERHAGCRIRYQASSLAGPPAITVRVAAPGEPAETFPAMPPGQLVDRLAGSRLIRLLPVGDPAPAEPAGGPQVREWDLLLGSPPARSTATRRPPRVPTARRAPPTTGSPRRPLADQPEPALLAAPDLTGDLGDDSIPVLAALLVAVQPLQDRLVVLDVPGQLGPPGQVHARPGQVALRSTGPEPSGPSADAAIGWVNDLRSAVRQLAGGDQPRAARPSTTRGCGCARTRTAPTTAWSRRRPPGTCWA